MTVRRLQPSLQPPAITGLKVRTAGVQRGHHAGIPACAAAGACNADIARLHAGIIIFARPLKLLLPHRQTPLSRFFILIRISRHPFAILNFPEGTRFTDHKYGWQASPYLNLLKPKSAGVAFFPLPPWGRK